MCCSNALASPVDLVSIRPSVESSRLRTDGALMNAGCQNLRQLSSSPAIFVASTLSSLHLLLLDSGQRATTSIKCPSRVYIPSIINQIHRTNARLHAFIVLQDEFLESTFAPVSVHKLPILFYIRRTQTVFGSLTRFRQRKPPKEVLDIPRGQNYNGTVVSLFARSCIPSIDVLPGARLARKFLFYLWRESCDVRLLESFAILQMTLCNLVGPD